MNETSARSANGESPFGPLISLWRETIVSLSLLAMLALVAGIAGALALEPLASGRTATTLVLTMIVADVAIFIAIAAIRVRALVIRPVADIVVASGAIAAGDLTRRLPKQRTLELHRLGESVNYLATRLLEGQAQLAHLEKMASLGQLATGVAQEIGTPLAAIHGHVRALRDKLGAASGNTQSFTATLDRLDRESDRIDRIVRGMLEYARPRRGSPTGVDVNAAVTAALQSLEELGTLAAVQVDLSLAPELARLRGDPQEILQVVANLLLNATQAMGGVGRVSVVTGQVPFAEVAREGERRANDPNNFAYVREPSTRMRVWLARVGAPKYVIRIVVADSGPGIAWSESERIFDPFYTTKAMSGAAGLGLAVVARVVESMGGTVWVRPSREGGAAFVIYLPVIPIADQDSQA